ncbi:hypothetical protein [Lentilactobacillus sp. Marseille-Q4993]|uniref:hypothetical protein n=1 Tax=Lentilactobacillus sp. Marseille-Q4993 TaxID=3039492 RepID=UPI0024BC8A62|nr:hypothetical protein [Lentilactobacillus sp. Marseille-Q4993]
MDKKILSSLSYLSIFFAPIIFPIIVWILSNDDSTIQNARKATFLHIAPVILTIIALFIIGTTGLLTNSGAATGFVTIGLVSVLLLVDFVLFIYNLVIGIKILVND